MTGADELSARRSNYVAAWGTGIGIGLIAFMVTWIVANRITAATMSVPAGPIVAMALAIVTGVVLSISRGRALSRPYRWS